MFESTMIVPGSYLEQAAQLTLNSVESYIKLQNMPNPTSPEEALYMKENAKKPFYGKIIPAAPILMQYILEADKTEDQKAVALDFAYAKHVLDPEFIEMLMQYLAGPEQTASSRAVVGAYLTLVLNDLLENSEERIDIEILQHPLTEDNYGYMIPRFMVIISRYFSKAVAA